MNFSDRLQFFLCPHQQAKAEEEEEFISNTLLKKIQSLKKEKETLAMNYEQEEEFLTNDLSRKLMQVLKIALKNIARFVRCLEFLESHAFFLSWET